MSGIVFINYRRSDAAGMAGRLFDRLEQEFSGDQLFFDVDNIPPGKDFVAYLNDKVGGCDVLLAVVGPDWQSQLDKQEYKETGEQTEDFVRIEIEAALSQSKTVIPVLVSGAEMPRKEDLPEALQPFARRNAVRLSHERFKADAAGITNALESALAEAEELRTAATAEAARLRAEKERQEKAAREAKEQAEKEAARREAAVSSLSAEQIAKAEELANWEFIKERNKPQELIDHLARFPKGVCVHMASEKLEALLWRDLEKAPTIAVLSSFLEAFPEGAHAAEARTRLDELQKTEAEERAANEGEQKELAAWEDLAIAEAGAAEHEGDTEWQRDLSISYERVGDVLKEQGNFTSALHAFWEGLAIDKRIAGADPDNGGLQGDLSISYAKVGDVLLAQGDLADALKYYQNSFDILKALGENEEEAIGMLGSLAYKFTLASDFTKALETADEAIALAPDTDNKIWIDGNRAHALMLLGRADEARAIYLQYRGKTNVLDEKSWETVVLNDFAEMRKAGIIDPLMNEIEKKFAADD
jgi:tetratricopeptide (TPR) repeat protein